MKRVFKMAAVISLSLIPMTSQATNTCELFSGTWKGSCVDEFKIKKSLALEITVQGMIPCRYFSFKSEDGAYNEVLTAGEHKVESIIEPIGSNLAQQLTTIKYGDWNKDKSAFSFSSLVHIINNSIGNIGYEGKHDVGIMYGVYVFRLNKNSKQLIFNQYAGDRKQLNLNEAEVIGDYASDAKPYKTCTLERQ